MITYFPKPYEDELAYSLFARFFMKSGYTTLKDVMSELYMNEWYRADVQFYNKLRPEVVEIITKEMPLQKFAEKHTMFPLYARFLKKERRLKAIQSMISMDGNYHNYLAVPYGVSERFIRYCPKCAGEDREKYGETFWHRSHQIEGIDICAIHRCKLHDTHIPIGVKSAYGLASAEEVVPMDNNIENVSDEMVCALAAYVVEVFEADMNYDADGIGSFLRSNLPAKYISDTGVTIRLEEVIRDIQLFFSSDPDVGKMQRIQKIYNGYRWNGYEICQIAMFENITASELVNYKNMDSELLHDTYNMLAEKYGLDYVVVSDIGNTVVRAYNNSFAKQKSGVQQKKWEELDEKNLQQVKNTIMKVINDSEARPVRITIHWICRQLGLTSKQIEKLPKCKNEIEKYAESQEHYWAREVLWVVRKLDEEGIKLCWRRIRELTNMRTVNLCAALPEIQKMTDTAMYDRIRQIYEALN